ncbi:MAG: N-acetylglucosamine-6-phosphate deacetylase [Candidatus Caldatribacteriaceae bacterium]
MECDLLLWGGKVVTEAGILEKGYVAIHKGRIISVGEDWHEKEASQKIDVSGYVVVPGFIDIHTHGVMNVDFVESNAQEVAEGIKHYLSFGVTRVVASTISRPLEDIIAQIRQLRWAKEKSEYGVLIHGVHVEGPWLSARCRGGHPLQYLSLPNKKDVSRLLEEGEDVIVTVTFAPELPGAVWLAEELSRRGIIPVIGHTEATYEEAERVIFAGARHVTHMYNGMLGYRENPQEALVMLPGVETAVLCHDSVSLELIGCPVHVPKPFFKFIQKVKPRDKKILVTDSLIGTGMSEGSILSFKDGRKVKIVGNVVRMIDVDSSINGNLTGSAVTMNVALRRLQEYAELSLEETLNWATINPARLLGIEHEVGSIAVGKRADLVVMDEKWNVWYTFLDGKVVFRKNEEG